TTLAVEDPADTCWPACNESATTVPGIGLLVVARETHPSAPAASARPAATAAWEEAGSPAEDGTAFEVSGPLPPSSPPFAFLLPPLPPLPPDEERNDSPYAFSARPNAPCFCARSCCARYSDCSARSHAALPIPVDGVLVFAGVVVVVVDVAVVD